MAHAQTAVRGAPDWLEAAARSGYAAKALVYIVVGALAAQVAYEGASSQEMSADGALATVAQQPFGQVLLLLIGVGLVGYALWRFVQASADPDHEGSDAKGIGKRIAYAASAVIHAGLAWSAFQLALGSGSGGGSDAQSWTAKALSEPWGQWAVGLVGAGIAVGALAQAHRAYSASFMRKLSSEMSPSEQKWTRRAGRAGHAARAVVFAIIAYFLIQAAITSNAGQAVGLDGALRTLAQQQYGTVLLSLAAVGLVMYGVFMAFTARYRTLPARINVN